MGISSALNKEKRSFVIRALYGLKLASAAFLYFIAKNIDKIIFKSCVSDPNVWMRPAM